MSPRTWIAAILLCVLAPGLCAQDGIPAEQFDSLRKCIRPQDGESRWRELDWLTSIQDARVKAAAEGKPIILKNKGRNLEA